MKREPGRRADSQRRRKNGGDDGTKDGFMDSKEERSKDGFING